MQLLGAMNDLFHAWVLSHSPPLTHTVLNTLVIVFFVLRGQAFLETQICLSSVNIPSSLRTGTALSGDPEMLRQVEETSSERPLAPCPSL